MAQEQTQEQNQDKVKGEGARRTQTSTGIVLIVLCGLSLMGYGGLRPTSSGFWIMLALVFLGAYLVVRGLEWGQLVKLHKTYFTLFANDASGSIDALAAAVGSSSDVVRRNLKTMIKRGVATNIAIDEQNNRVVFSAPAASARVGVGGAANQPVMVDVTCAACGASNNILHGATVQCAHCGESVSAA